MLTALSIRDVVLIEALDLEFGPGLTALTGETGAGKSILLDALGLALGARGDSALVRTGAPHALAAAEFAVAADHPARALIVEHGLDAEGGLRVRRQLRGDGGGRAWAQDVAVGAGVLREIGAALVEVHGQNDERGMLNPRGHRALIDDYGGLAVAGVAALHAAWRDAEAALRAARAGIEAAARDRDYLEHAAAELAALAALPGEEASLADERRAMQAGARLAGDLDAVEAHLGGSDGALAGLRQAARRLERMGGEHETLAAALAAIDRAIDAGGEAEGALVVAREALAADPARLEAVETRLFELRAAARKYRVGADALATLAADFAARLEALVAGESGIAACQRSVATARAAYVTAAGALTAARGAAAARLAAAVAGELGPLKLEAARFRVAIVPLDETQWGAHGHDRVEFEIATNPGAPFGPLTRVASGGELSRFTLALKVALAATREAGTIIFDEIDRGVGGAVASAIGERLARLAAATQVIVVTHSPQVAAAAGRQLRISKADGRTRVVALTEAERREEIARMLSGAEVTDEARAQAARLLAR